MPLERNLNEYVAGFIDGEGCFSLSFRKDVRHERSGSPVYYSWKAMFAVMLRIDDEEVLHMVKDTLGCGSITHAQAGAVRYQVANLDDLQAKLVPFFIRYPLIGKKGRDFELWKEAVQILYAKKHGMLEGDGKASEVRLESVHALMRQYKATSADKPLRRPARVPLGEPI